MKTKSLTLFVLTLAAFWSAGCGREPSGTQPATPGATGTSNKSPSGKPSTSSKQDGPAPRDNDAAKALSKERLLGEWEGSLKDGTILALLFTDKLVVVSFLAPGTNREKAREAAEWASGNLGRAAGSIGSTAYEIDAANNEVKFWGAMDWGGKAKLTEDGALLISGDLKMGTAPETRLVRATK